MANTKKTASKKSSCCGAKKSDNSVTKNAKTTSRAQSKKSNSVK